MFGIGATEAAVLIMTLFVVALLAGIFVFWRAVGRGGSKDDLVTCPQCGRKISREYSTCPECGHAMAPVGDPSSPLVGRPPLSASQQRRPTA